MTTVIVRLGQDIAFNGEHIYLSLVLYEYENSFVRIKLTLRESSENECTTKRATKRDYL